MGEHLFFSFNSDFKMFSLTAFLLEPELATLELVVAIQISLTSWLTFWSPLTTGSKYTRMMFRNADKHLIRLCICLF